MGIDNVFTDAAPAPFGAYSQAVKSGNLIFVSGQIPVDMSTGLAVAEGVHKETRVILDNIDAILRATGSSLQKVVKFTVFLQKIDDIKWVNEVMAERFGKALPARSTVEVSRLPRNVSIEIEAIAEA